MIRFFSLASGSSGNAIYLGDENTGLLIDAGISAKRITESLTEKGISPESLSGILITHEHIDHIGGLAVLLKRYRVPVYATPGTINAIRKQKNCAEIPFDCFVPISHGSQFTIGAFAVNCCGILHDAAEPVAYSFMKSGHKIGMATDLGSITEEIVAHLSGSELLYLESNYDRYMLLAGPYPYSLKQRIMSDSGHLSNEDSARLVSHVVSEKLRHIVLAHLSKENNVPDLALITMQNELDGIWNYDIPKPRLIVAPRDQAMDILTIS